MLALPRLNSDHRHARVDKQPGHKGDGDTLSPFALVVFELSVTQGMKSSRQSWSRHGLHFKGALSPTLQSDSLRSTSISLPGCNPRWNPGQVSGERGATLGVNKPPTAFLRRADDSNKNLSSSALWGARVPFQGEIVLLHIAGSEGAFQVERVCQECELDFLLVGHTMGYHGGAP